MAILNPYLTYKRDTSRLIYWIINTSNHIIASSPPSFDDRAEAQNTIGQITVSALVSLSKLISKHVATIPTTVLDLFNSVIQARTAQYEAFSKLVLDRSDPEIERSNASHKHFIDALTEAFNNLGGKAWTESQTEDPAFADPSHSADNQDDIEDVLFANRFAILSLATEPNQESEDSSAHESDTETQPNRAPRKRQQKRPRKGKKRKNARQPQSQKSGSRILDNVPIENYRIIQDTQGMFMEYRMAVQALSVLLLEHFRTWLSIMVERSAAAMFVDFLLPGCQSHDSFETLINTLTHGDQEKAQETFKFEIRVEGPNGAKVYRPKMDIKEQFLIHAYRDLLDFVTDFQKNRSGKPTKRMLKEINNWDPNLDHQAVSEAERLRWRHCYTINWLYDLVNNSSTWDKQRCLLGLNKFASYITHLAMQKPESDIRHKILPHHVFQLQCIVDSFTVFRG